MKTLEIKEQNVLSAYNRADANSRQLLTDLFGQEVFNQKITDRVKTFEDAAMIVGVVPENIEVMLSYKTDDKLLKATDAFVKLAIITQALNEGWTPNWDNSNEAKYYPWFNMESGGFSDVSYIDWRSSSDVGSRLCFRSRELAEYAHRQFNDLYKDFMHL